MPASSQGVCEGAAWIAVEWDVEGRARDVLVLSARYPAIGRAVEEAVYPWRRDPQLKGRRNDKFIVAFKAEGIVVMPQRRRGFPSKGS